MFRKICRSAITLLGAGLGLALTSYLDTIAAKHGYFNMAILQKVWFQYSVSILLIAICSLIAWLLSSKITNGLTKFVGRIDKWQQNKSVSDLFLIVLATVVGLLIAYLCGNLTARIPSDLVALSVNVIIYLLCPYVISLVVWKRRADIPLPHIFKRKDSKKALSASEKLLDSSAIIDGRIYDICKTGFIEGKLVVPDFTVKEIMDVASSQDEAKRSRGRRGLDIIKNLQDELKMPIEVKEIAYDDISDNASKLLKYAVDNAAVIITTDYSLNKAANLRKVKALNVNELTNAIKTVLVPGEVLSVKIVKAGKERKQGLAYLDDGTMIVVENGMEHVGTTCTVEVSNVMQTAAGRMVFADLVEM